MSAELEHLKGSIPALVTPFKNGEVDYDMYELLVKFEIENETHGMLVDGTTSEPALLTVEERNRRTDLWPGDIIATGTPAGAGARFDPPKYLVPGDVVDVE